MNYNPFSRRKIELYTLDVARSGNEWDAKVFALVITTTCPCFQNVPYPGTIVSLARSLAATASTNIIGTANVFV